MRLCRGEHRKRLSIADRHAVDGSARGDFQHDGRIGARLDERRSGWLHGFVRARKRNYIRDTIWSGARTRCDSRAIRTTLRSWSAPGFALIRKSGSRPARAGSRERHRVLQIESWRLDYCSWADKSRDAQAQRAVAHNSRPFLLIGHWKNRVDVPAFAPES